jgi:hypothetical protein
MSDDKVLRTEPIGEHRRAGDEPRSLRLRADGWEAYSNWLNRAQKSGGRHSAITRNLYSWSNYKNWADKVRNSWDQDK